VFDAQARLQLLPPDHELAFLPKNASPSNQQVPRLSAAFTIIRENTAVTPQPPPVTNPPKEPESNTLANEHAISTTTITSSEQILNAPIESPQRAHTIEEVSNKHRPMHRYQLMGVLFVLCLVILVIGIAAASRPISLYWPESRWIFERLHLPVTTPQP
jgi:hypothetical protein